MKSRISIGIDEDNQPVIQVNFVESDDVRDKLISRMLYAANETFTMKIACTGVGPGASSYDITPVLGKDLEKHTNMLRSIIENRTSSLGGILQDAEMCPSANPLRNNPPDTCN